MVNKEALLKAVTSAVLLVYYNYSSSSSSSSTVSLLFLGDAFFALLAGGLEALEAGLWAA